MSVDADRIPKLDAHVGSMSFDSLACTRILAR